MKYCEAQKKDCWLVDRQSFFTFSAVIFYVSILVNQFFKVRRGGVGAVQLGLFCHILSQIVEVDVIPVYIHYRAYGAASGLIDLQEIIRVVGKQGEILIQGLGVPSTWQKPSMRCAFWEELAFRWSSLVWLP